MLFYRMDNFHDVFLFVTADKKIEHLEFVDLCFYERNKFFKFCEQLKSYSNLKELSFINMNNLHACLMNESCRKKFYDTLKDLKFLEKIIINYSHLGFLDFSSLRKLLRNLVQLDIMQIDLYGNDFNQSQIQIIQSFDKQHADKILINLNLSKILESMHLPNDIKNYITSMVLKPSMQLKVEKTLYNRDLNRLTKNCFFSKITQNLNSSVEFEQYVAAHGGNKAKAGALIALPQLN